MNFIGHKKNELNGKMMSNDIDEKYDSAPLMTLPLVRRCDSRMVFGPFNTGTTLIEKLCRIPRKQMHSRLWKHNCSHTNLEQYVVANPSVLCIFIYKPFFHWVRSMIKANYSMTHSHGRPIKKDTVEESILWNRHEDSLDGREKAQDMLDVYCEYYHSFTKLCSLHANTVLIDYEQLISDAGREYFESQTGVSCQGFDEIMSRPAKAHGQCRTRVEVRQSWDTVRSEIEPLFANTVRLHAKLSELQQQISEINVTPSVGYTHFS